MSGSETSQRRCAACRREASKYELLRFVVGPSGELCFDLRQKAPGRGVSVCATEACLQKALGGSFKRSHEGLREHAMPTFESLIAEQVLPALTRRYRELLVDARRCGQLVLGSGAVEDASMQQRLCAYLLASDASASTRQKVEQNAGRKGLAVNGRLTRTELGALFGREELVVAGWIEAEAAARAGMLEQQLAALGRPTGLGEKKVESGGAAPDAHGPVPGRSRKSGENSEREQPARSTKAL